MTKEMKKKRKLLNGHKCIFGMRLSYNTRGMPGIFIRKDPGSTKRQKNRKKDEARKDVYTSKTARKKAEMQEKAAKRAAPIKPQKPS